MWLAGKSLLSITFTVQERQETPSSQGLIAFLLLKSMQSLKSSLAQGAAQLVLAVGFMNAFEKP